MPLIGILINIKKLLIYSLNINNNYTYNDFIENLNFRDILPIINISNKDINYYINELFNNRQLFINEVNLSNKYIHFIRDKTERNDDEEQGKYLKEKFLYQNITFNLSYFKNNEEKVNYTKFGKFCVEEKLINSDETKDYRPIISVIIPSFNKSNVIMKSIRSIQNQSFKNIEIIIVDDHSTDNSRIYFDYLLKTEPRIRIFTHLHNMGVWRSRLDGFLYSRGKYIIHFDAGDLYSDPYVLEDAYHLIEKYKLDSIKMMFRLIYNYSNIKNSSIPFPIKNNYTKIIYGSQNIKKYNNEIFSTWGNIWTRLTRANIINKGLFLLDSKILNIYKNLWEDCWWNKIINEASNSFLIINRNAYLYFKDYKGEGDIKINTDSQKNKIILEFIHFLYFDFKLLPKESNKNEIINQLHKYTKNKKINLKFLNSQFNVLNELLILLIKDPYISNIKKVFLKRLLKVNKNKEKNKKREKRI